MADLIVSSAPRQILSSDTGVAAVGSVVRQILSYNIGVASIDSIARLVLVSTSQEVTEAANATDTFNAGMDYAVSVVEPATASDIVFTTDGLFTALTTETLLAENATLTVDGLSSETLLAEPCLSSIAVMAVETLLVSRFFVTVNVESAQAEDSYDATRIAAPRPPPPPAPRPPIVSTNVAIKQTSYPPVPTNMTDPLIWNAQIATTVNLVLSGKTNNTLATFTFNANSTTTTLYMSQIGATSVISLTPLTANAAAERWHISGQIQGQATINHSDSVSTDRTYSVVVVA